MISFVKRFKVRFFFSNWNKVNPILLVSTGRTGTKFFFELFDVFFSNIYSVHEPTPDLLELSLSYRRHNISKKKALTQFKKSRICEYKKAKKLGRYFEANNNLTLLSPLLIDQIETLKVIHITRHPYTFIRSAYHKKNLFKGQEYLFYHDNDKRKRLTPFDNDDLGFQGRWKDMPRILKIAWYWNTYNKELLDIKEDNSNYKCFKYENVFDSRYREKTINEMIRFINVQPKAHFSYDHVFFNKKVNTSEYDEDSFDIEMKKYQEEILTICGDTMSALEYDWKNKGF